MSRFVEHFSSHDSQPDPRAATPAGRQNIFSSYQSQSQQNRTQEVETLPGLQDLRITPQSPLSPQTPQGVSQSPSPSSSTMSDTDSLAPETWIASFCSLLGHEYFAEVSEDFIEDDFNLTGLQSQVPMYKEALEMILDVEPEDDEDDEDEEDADDDDEDMRDENGELIGQEFRRERRHMRAASDLSVIESSAELLYGLIHQRYITSRPGIQQMAEKYEQAIFGHCPRVMCNQARTLPVGLYDTPGVDTVKLFCPSCLDVYTPPNSRFQSVDGAFFGTTFGCLFFMTFPDFEIAPRGDPLRLATTNPIFGAGSSALPAPRERSTQSRSSSLTSNNLTPVPASVVPVDWLPPPDQPQQMNGIATTNLAPGLGKGKIYEPKIYGFRVSERAKTGPRMKWLRSRPVDIRELDEAGHFNGEYPSEEGEQDDDGMRPEDFYSKGGAQTAAPGELQGRKKAVAVSRRNMGGLRKADLMDTNGIGQGG